MSECVFCKILKKEIKTEIIYEDDLVAVFNDISPRAPLHLLVISKQHFDTINDLSDSEFDIVAAVFRAVKKLSVEKGFDKAGYRVCYNKGKNAGQAVGHIHFHLLAGRQFAWPPG